MFLQVTVALLLLTSASAHGTPILKALQEDTSDRKSLRLNVTRDPLPALWDDDNKTLIPAVANILAPRFVSAQRLDDDENGDTPTRHISASLLRRLTSHSRINARKHKQSKRLVPGLSDMLKQAFKFDDGWKVYTAPAENTEIDNEWLVDMGFGTPSQNLKVVFDTGSPDTWVYSPACCYHANHHFFDPSSSKTFNNRTLGADGRAEAANDDQAGTPWSISYGGGSTSEGYIGLDALAFPSAGLQVSSSPVALATSIKGASRAARAMEGLVGLSNGAASEAKGGWVTPLEALVREGKLAKPYLTAAFTKANRRTGFGGGGHYILGDLDPSTTPELVAWTNVTSSVYWGADYRDMRIGSASVSPPAPTNRRLIMDTGSALINLPKASSKLANAAIADSHFSSSVGFWLVPCRTGLPEYEASLPQQKKNQPFVLELDSGTFSVSPEDFVFYPNNPISPSEANGRSDMCIGAFQQGPEAFAVVGATFIKNHAVTFDVGDGRAGQRRIGIANRTQSLP